MEPVTQRRNDGVAAASSDGPQWHGSPHQRKR